eukprot:10680254-Prorocentrum_lima.AAC.1
MADKLSCPTNLELLARVLFTELLFMESDGEAPFFLDVVTVADLPMVEQALQKGLGNKVHDMRTATASKARAVDGKPA